MRKRSVRGGPFDGSFASATPDQFVFIDADGHVSNKSGPGTVLYYYLDERWVFAGHGAYVCKCGAFVRQSMDETITANCPLCGSKRVT